MLGLDSECGGQTMKSMASLLLELHRTSSGVPPGSQDSAQPSHLLSQADLDGTVACHPAASSETRLRGSQIHFMEANSE